MSKANSDTATEKGIDYYNLLFSREKEYDGTVNEFDGLNLFIKNRMGNNNYNFLEALGRFVQGAIAYNNYLNNVKPGLQENEDFVDLFSFLTSILGL